MKKILLSSLFLLALIGVKAGSPTITTSSHSMSGFTYEESFGPSTTQTNNLSWTDLVGSVSSLNTVNYFQFSNDAGATWQAGTAMTVPIPPIPGSSPWPTPVLVRLISGLSAGTYLDTLVLSSPGADTVRIHLAGTVVDYAWTGATSTDWNTASNWSSNFIPGLLNVAHIPDVSGASGNFPTITASQTLGNTVVAANAHLDITTGIILDGVLTNNGTVTLKNGAYLDDFTNAGASFVGNITVETIAANGVSSDQRFISSPVNTPNVSEIGDDLLGPWGAGLPGTNGVAVTVDDCMTPTLAAGSNYGNLFEYDETLLIPLQCDLDGWVVRSSGTLENARGYSAYLVSGSTFDFTGTPNSGAIQINATNSGSAVSSEGWNLLGNPYPSPISRDAVITAGASDLQYFVTSGVYEGTYSAYNPGSNIAIGQGFQAHVNTTGNINFDNTMRNTNAATWYQNENWFEYKLEISVFGPDYADKTTLFYNNDATNNYEPMFDVMKRKSSKGHPTLSTFGVNKNLSLNGMSVNDLGETVPMSLEAGANGSFTLRFEGKETFPANTTIYVKDLATNTVHNIENGDYIFTASTTDAAERFEIILVPAVEFAVNNINCEGEAGIISLASNLGVQNRTFEISQNGVVLNTNSLVNLNETIENTGNYSIVVADNFGGNQEYNIEVTQDEAIISDFVAPLEVTQGESFILSSITNNASDLIWTIENQNISNASDLSYSFAEAGVYEISLTALNKDCSDTKIRQIVVNAKTTGISNELGNKIKSYPNPVNNYLVIETDEEIVVEIYSVLGENILTTTSKEISFTDFTKGVYILKILNNQSEIISTNKVVKN